MQLLWINWRTLAYTPVSSAMASGTNRAMPMTTYGEGKHHDVIRYTMHICLTC